MRPFVRIKLPFPHLYCAKANGPDGDFTLDGLRCRLGFLLPLRSAPCARKQPDERTGVFTRPTDHGRDGALFACPILSRRYFHRIRRVGYSQRNRGCMWEIA